MSENYKIPELEFIINKIINPIPNKSKEWMLIYRLLHSVIYYYEYATAAVLNQEKGFKNKEPDAIIVGSAVSTYLHIKSCLNLFNKALMFLSNENISPSELKIVKKRYHLWSINQITHLRDRVGAHPDEGARNSKDKNYFIMSKRTMISDNGTVKLMQISIENPANSEIITLTPRVDLNKLQEFLTESSLALKSEIADKIPS